MKVNHIITTLLVLTLISCSPVITSYKKEYQITEKSKLQSDWKFDIKEWSLENQIINGSGSAEHWAAITSKKELPENYEITLSINLISGNLFETMLHFDK